MFRILNRIIIFVIILFQFNGQAVHQLGDAYPDEVMIAFLEMKEVQWLGRISAYNAVPSQTEGNPNVSSCGPNQPSQVAVSRDLFFDENGTKHLCGTTGTIVTYRGEIFDVVIWDTMNPRFTESADILMTSIDSARQFGITSGFLIFD